MNIYLKKDSIEKLFNKVSDNLILSDDEAPANKFLMGDYTKVFTDDTGSFINAQERIFQERASIKFPEENENELRENYIKECRQIASPTDGASYVGIHNAENVEENDYTFFLDSDDNTNTPTWIHDKNKDIYQELTGWLKDNVFKEESYSSYMPKKDIENNKETKFDSFLSNAFYQKNKITDIIIYDPYILEIFHKKNKPDDNTFNSTLFNQLKNLEKLNIIIFTSNIIKFGLARRKIYKNLETNNNQVTFIEISKKAHDRFILSNYFYIKSGKGFMLDLDENLGNDVTASKIGINTCKTFLEWSEKRNILQDYLNDTEAKISQGVYKSKILSFTPENLNNLNKIIEEKCDNLLYTAILEKSSNYKAIIRMTPHQEEIDNISKLNDETLTEKVKKITDDYVNREKERLINCINNAISEFSKDAKIPTNWFLGNKEMTKNQLIKLCKLFKLGLKLDSTELVNNIKDFYKRLTNKLSDEKLSKFKPTGGTSDSDNTLAHEFMMNISDTDLENKTDYIINIFNHLCNTQQNNTSTNTQKKGLQQNLQPKQQNNNNNNKKKNEMAKTDQPASLEDLQKKWSSKHSKDNK